MPRRGRGGFGIVHSHQAPKSFRSSDRWDIDEDFQQSNKMFFFSSASDPSFSPPSGYHNQSATEHRLLDHFKDVGRGSQSNDGLYYKAEQVLGISGHSSLVDMKYSRESHKVNSVRGMGFVREPPMMVQSDLDRHNPVGNLKSKKPKKVKNQALEQWGVDQGNSSSNCPTNGHGNGKRAASPNSFVCQLLEGIDDFHSLDQPSLVESGRSNSKSTTFASSVAAYQKSMRDMELAIVPQPSVFDRVNMSDLKHKRKIKQEPPDLARRPASKKSFAELEEGELAESGSTNDHSERNYVRRSRKSPEYREGSPITRHSAGHHRSMAMEKGDNGSRRDVRIVRYTSYSPVISVKKEYHEVRRVRRYDGDGSKDRTDSRFFKCTPERSCSRSRSRSRSSDYARRGRRSSLPSPRRKSMRRSPSRSPRRGSPRRSPPRSPRRGSPRRSPRSSRRESPRRSPVRSPRRSLTRSPCRSPIRYPRRSPSCYSRRSSRRSPQHSTRRSPRRSSRHSPRNSPRRSSHTRRRRSSSRSSGRMHTTRSCSRSPERPKRRRTSRSSSRSRSSLSSITRSGSHQDDSQDFRGQSVQTNATSAVPKLINSLDYGPGSHPDSRTPFATPNVIVNPQIPFLPLGARISVIPEVTPMSFSVAPSAPQPSSIKSEIPAMPTGTDSASHRLMRGPPALIPVHAPVQRVSEQAEAEAREDEETKKRRYQRDEYQKKRDKLVHELFRLQTQQADSVTKHQLVNADKETKRLEVLIVENAKLQQVITNRVRMLDDLIAKHTSALQEDVDAARTMSQADYFYFDSQHHWCSVCDVVLPKMDAYLLHLHSSQHEINWMSQGVPSFPWHKLRLQDVNVCTAQSKRVPFHGLPFLQPVKAWFCRLCEVWIGDVNHAKVHLSSPEHNTAYLKYIVENPDWETNRSLKRQESLKRTTQQRKVTAEQKRIEEEAKKKQIDEENDKNWKIFVQHQATINSPTVELDEPGAPEPVGDYKSVKSIRLNVRSLAAKKDDPALDSSTPSAVKDVAIGQEPRENENNAGAPPESQTPKKNEETEISAQKTVERDQSVDCSGSSLNTRETEAGARQRAPDDAGKSGDFVPLSKIKQEKPDVDDGPPPVMSSDMNDPCPRLPSE